MNTFFEVAKSFLPGSASRGGNYDLKPNGARHKIPTAIDGCAAGKVEQLERELRSKVRTKEQALANATLAISRLEAGQKALENKLADREKHWDYQLLIERIRTQVVHHVPSGDVVAAISKGDSQLVEYPDRLGMHFPCNDDGVYAGHYPETSAAAVAHLQKQCGFGATHLMIPDFARWWLDHYKGLAKFLEDDFEQVCDEPGVCHIYRDARVRRGRSLVSRLINPINRIGGSLRLNRLRARGAKLNGNGSYSTTNRHPIREDVPTNSAATRRHHEPKQSDFVRHLRTIETPQPAKVLCQSDLSAWECVGGAVKSGNQVNLSSRGAGFSGVARRGVEIVPGAYYRLTFSGEINDSEVFWIVRDANSQAELNYYLDNYAVIQAFTGKLDSDEPFTIDFRAYSTAKSLDVFLVMRSSGKSPKLTLDRVELTQLTPTDAIQPPQLANGDRVIASLASIPGREQILQESLRSLYPQVDEIRVFLNGYSEAPEFLLGDSKIVLETSQTWGDDGDAGKFFWADDATPGYRLICDDDIVYPQDYARRMIDTVQKYGDRVVAGVHGVFLKQPVREYYNPKERAVCGYHNRNEHDLACHVLGTGAIAYRANRFMLRKSDFQCRNMADIWLTKVAQAQQIPLVCVERLDNWLMPQEDAKKESIYAASSAKASTSMNTSLVQSNVIRGLYPVTVSAMSGSRTKLVFAVKTYNRLDYLEECLASFCKTCSPDYEWVIVVADDGSTDGTLEYLENLSVRHEVHVLRNNRRYAVGQTNTIFELCQQIGFDIAFCADDDIVFTKPGWDDLYVNAIRKSGWTHLVHRHLAHCENLARRKDEFFEIPTAAQDSSRTCVAYGGAHFDLGTGGLFTFTPETLGRVGYCDEANFPIRGQWHVDLHIRCCRAGCNDETQLFDAAGSNDYVEIQNYLKPEYRCAIPWNDEYKKTKDPAELERRQALLNETTRVYIGPPRRKHVRYPAGANDVFDEIYVLNLDRRPDRWSRILSQAQYYGIQLTRFAAVDGRAEPHASEFAKYQSQPLTQAPADMAIDSSFQFYRNYPSDMARVAYHEAKHQRKAIASPGAWGYQKTMIRILEDALEKDHEHILVLDDDVVFHKDFNDLLPSMLTQAPDDWRVLQLGALQYHWEPQWVEWYSDNLYMCKGSSLGSHAVALHRDIIPMILNHCYRYDLPYDEGPLHKPKATFPRQCFTFYPNLLVQDVSESDISDNTNQRQLLSQGSNDNSFRWNLDDYSFAIAESPTSFSTPARQEHKVSL